MAAIKKNYTFKENSLTPLPDNQTATITLVETSKDGDTTVGVVEIKLQVVVIEAKTIS